jgi:hypothetical protein
MRRAETVPTSAAHFELDDDGNLVPVPAPAVRSDSPSTRADHLDIQADPPPVRQDTPPIRVDSLSPPPATSSHDAAVSGYTPNLSGVSPFSNPASSDERIQATISMEKKDWTSRIVGKVDVERLAVWWAAVRPGGVAHGEFVKDLNNQWEVHIVAPDVDSAGATIYNWILHMHENAHQPDHAWHPFPKPAGVTIANIRGLKSFFMAARMYRMSVYIVPS